MQVRRDDPTNPAITALLAAHVAEQRGAVPEGFSFALDGRALSAPEIAFFIAWNDGVVAGMGALKQLGDGGGEVKSMRSTAAARGRGAGHAILLAIIGEARRRGLTRLYLETSTTPAYDAAIRLYTRAGFVPCDAFAEYRPSPHNRFFVLHL